LPETEYLADPAMQLTRLSIPQSVLAKILFGSIVVAVPVGAFLAFSVQPVVGKLLLPSQGGAASTWLGTMLYFQLTLLLGYGWATWLLQRAPRYQVSATAGLALVALVFTHLRSVQEGRWTGMDGILLTLALATLPAMVLLFSIGPLMHGWLRKGGQPVPYHLYAGSNAGGLAAVLLYPFTIEREIGLADQIFLWQGLLWVVVWLIGAAGLCFLRTAPPPEPSRKAQEEQIPLGRMVTWLGLSALTCLGMLGATHHLAAEIGSNPVAWVGPFGVYLLSFLVTFSGWWQPRYTIACIGWLAVSLAGFMLAKGVSNATVNGWAAFWLVSLTAAGSFFGNGLIHGSRPNERFGFFYLILAAGGVIGGLFASFAAPIFFLRPSEFLAVSFLLLVLGLVRLLGRRDVLNVSIAILIVLAPVAGLVWQQTRDEAVGSTRVRRFRNIYGYLMLKSEENGLVLSNETTTHGTQITTNAETRRRPTLYYTESTGVGRVIEEAQRAQPSISIGVLGLGAGTIAAYARAPDNIDFWDIDPNAIRMARDYFTFIANSPGHVQVHEEDGRKGLERSRADYDVIVLDAYSGDGIPAHLLTREAMMMYFSKLEKRQGVLVVHATNRYSTLFPVVGTTANVLGWSSVKVATHIARTAAARDWDCTDTEYILVCRPAQLKGLLAWFPAEEDDGRVSRTLTSYDPLPPGERMIWTDDRHAILDCLDLRRYLFGK
jgi:hypothetical protein